MAGAGLLGNYFSGQSRQSSARASMRFQEKSAKHAHQWEVDDLRKAGLNPILSGTGGPGARVGGGAQSQMPDMGQAMATAAQVAKFKAETRVANQTSESIQQSMDIKLPEQLLKLDAARVYNSAKRALRETTKYNAAKLAKAEKMRKKRELKITKEKSDINALKKKNQDLFKNRYDVQNPSGKVPNRKAVHHTFKPRGTYTW